MDNHTPATVPASAISRLAKVFALVLVIILGWLAAIAWHERRLTDAVHSLPPDLQEATFLRAYGELTSTCTSEPRLASHCRDEAEFVLRFPQCTAECQEIARQYFPSVTK